MEYSNSKKKVQMSKKMQKKEEFDRFFRILWYNIKEVVAGSCGYLFYDLNRELQG